MSAIRRIGRVPVAGDWLRRFWHGAASYQITRNRPKLIYANTICNPWQRVRQLVPKGVPLIVHVHELERGIQNTAGFDGMRFFGSRANRFVAMSPPVAQNLFRSHGIPPSLIELIPSFIAIDESVASEASAFSRRLRQGLGIPDAATVVGGCGGTIWRKGVDLFVEMARLVYSRADSETVHFVWVGEVLDDQFTRSLMTRVRDWGLSGVCHFVGPHARPSEIFCGFDVFVLSSREEPMGLVALEAASVGKPIVCFAEAGGMPGFVAEDCGRVVSPVTGEALASGVLELLENDGHRRRVGERASEKVRSLHDIEVVAPLISDLIRAVGQF